MRFIEHTLTATVRSDNATEPLPRGKAVSFLGVTGLTPSHPEGAPWIPQIAAGLASSADCQPTSRSGLICKTGRERG
jgi:hypothetical protein